MKEVRECPICDWKHEAERPQVPAGALASVFGPGVMSAVAMQQHAQDIERALDAHFRTHSTVDWVRATARLRATIREQGAMLDALTTEASKGADVGAALRARVADGDVVRGDLQTVADVLRDYEGETVWQQAQAAVARVAELEADVRDARGLLRGMIDAKDGRVARFLIERAERFIERAAGNKPASLSGE